MNLLHLNIQKKNFLKVTVYLIVCRLILKLTRFHELKVKVSSGLGNETQFYVFTKQIFWSKTKKCHHKKIYSFTF